MDFAVIGDIHGNLPALEAVLIDIDKKGINHAYCVGDIVGESRYSDQCVQLLIERRVASVLGNMDWLAMQLNHRARNPTRNIVKLKNGGNAIVDSPIPVRELHYLLSESSISYLNHAPIESDFGIEGMLFSHSPPPVIPIIFYGYQFKNIGLPFMAKPESISSFNKMMNTWLNNLFESAEGDMPHDYRNMSERDKVTHDQYIEKVRDTMNYLRGKAKEEGLPRIISWSGHSHQAWCAVDSSKKDLSKIKHFNYRAGSFSLKERALRGRNLSINPGALGTPAEKKGKAYYAVCWQERMQVEMCSVPYHFPR